MSVIKARGYTVQDDLLAREIFGEFVSEIQLADFILAICYDHRQ